MKNNYDKILKASIGLMDEFGYHGTSIKMIAEKSGITKSGVLHHFKSKEEILATIVKMDVEAWTHHLLLIVKDDELSGHEKLKKFLRFQLNHWAKNKRSMNIFLRESRYLGNENRIVYNRSRRIYGHLVKEIIQQIKAENESFGEDLDISVVTNGILGMCNWVSIWYSEEGKYSIDQIADQFYKILEGRLFSS
ncbi:MAG: TetR/AcrR family transcriptional regulator [Desulfobacterales bacterium]